MGAVIKICISFGLSKKENTMKKEIDTISFEDADIICKHFNLKGIEAKAAARLFLRKKNIGVLDALLLVEKQKSCQPKSKSF